VSEGCRAEAPWGEGVYSASFGPASQPAEALVKVRETAQNRSKMAICKLAISQCIMHDIAAAGLYGPPHPLSGGV
jgi:hypothetical protein